MEQRPRRSEARVSAAGRRAAHSIQLLFLVPLVIVLLGLAAGCRTSAALCPACERAECKNMAFTIHLASGRSVATCCPRCGLLYLDVEHPKVASLTVREFQTAASLDAERAFYVEGSDVTPCTTESAAAAAPKDERGCCISPVYDRCLPSLLAFRDRQEAAAFARVHGGDVKELREIRAEKRAARG